ncbi:MAG: tRNA (N6-threonylcarbamoyladenosine(37)-N6)-methyltransferase TrmO [Deltaproteobacteria bacterium RIFOXYD12_FULL_50_9]|nr:MAG: tRNA (N6-threonylcarbamoyladenosine(37)-N6)-methyltransferase TrmO [Deltaproteobacteria bacterium RIFOXYD12_FULL_50_9]
MEQTEEITVTPIGVMHCGLRTPADAPRNFTESAETGIIEIFPAYLDAMEGLEAGQTLVVLFWLHKARRDLLKVYPRGDRSRGLRGVFTTRSPMRPNPIALSELKVLKVQDNSIEVSGVDVIDGTPILDIKSTPLQNKEKN